MSANKTIVFGPVLFCVGLFLVVHAIVSFSRGVFVFYGRGSRVIIYRANNPKAFAQNVWTVGMLGVVFVVGGAFAISDLMFP
jgi:hypothetical protein